MKKSEVSGGEAKGGVPEWWSAMPEGERELLRAVARLLGSGKCIRVGGVVLAGPSVGVVPKLAEAESLGVCASWREA